MERGSPRSDCGRNFRRSEGEGNAVLQRARVATRGWTPDIEGPQSLRGLPRSRSLQKEAGAATTRLGCFVADLLQQSRRLSSWLEHEDSLVVARALIILIGRTINMLEHQVKWQHQRFVQEGGFREQLSSQRQEVRGQQQNAPSCPVCGDRMARRQTRSGAAFWGCCAYPKCQGSRPAEEGRRPPEERRR